MIIEDMNTGLIHLRELTLQTDGVDDGEYPFNVQTVKNISQLTFTSSVTIFVGENGSGKSTLLEGLAMAVGSVAIGREEISRDEAFKAVAPLAVKMNLVWNKRTHRGFFLRAEDFFGFVQRIRSLRQEMLDEITRLIRIMLVDQIMLEPWQKVQRHLQYRRWITNMGQISMRTRMVKAS